jgi:hypothetical protein
LEKVVDTVIDLAFRISTDDQYDNSAPEKILASEIIDFLEKNMDKSIFIQAYSDVKAGIL